KLCPCSQSTGCEHFGRGSDAVAKELLCDGRGRLTRHSIWRGVEARPTAGVCDTAGLVWWSFVVRLRALLAAELALERPRWHPNSSSERLITVARITSSVPGVGSPPVSSVARRACVTPCGHSRASTPLRTACGSRCVATPQGSSSREGARTRVVGRTTEPRP